MTRDRPAAGDPLFSVVTPSYQQGAYIAETVESVLKGGVASFEHLVIDGGSTDETLSVLARYPHLRVVSEPDEGQSHALEKGFAAARGRFVGWLNSDDWYAPGALAAAARALESSPVVVGSCAVTDEKGVVKYVLDNPGRDWNDLVKFWIPYSIPTQPAIFVRREVLEEARRPDGRLFDRALHYCMDYDLWLRIAERHSFARRLPALLAYYRMTPSNKTSDLGDGMTHAAPEMARVARSATARRLGLRGGVTVVILDDGGGADAVTETLRSVGAAYGSSVEVVAATVRTGSRAVAAAVREAARDVAGLGGATFGTVCTAGSPDVTSLARSAAGAVGTTFSLFLSAGGRVDPGWFARVHETFAADGVGAAWEGASLFGSGGHVGSVPRSFAARTAALGEILPGDGDGGWAGLLVRVLTRALVKGWGVTEGRVASAGREACAPGAAGPAALLAAAAECGDVTEFAGRRREALRSGLGGG